MIRHSIKMSLALGLALSLQAGLAAAQAANAGGDASLAQSMAACGRIGNTQQRVACYDALNQSATPASVEERREAKRRSFGINAPHIANPFAPPAAVKQARAAARHEEGEDHILAKLDHSSRSPTGQLILTTTEGAVWLLDDASSPLEPTRGSQIMIRRGAMGSLFCDLDRWHATRCKRLE